MAVTNREVWPAMVAGTTSLGEWRKRYLLTALATLDGLGFKIYWTPDGKRNTSFITEPALVWAMVEDPNERNAFGAVSIAGPKLDIEKPAGSNQLFWRSETENVSSFNVIRTDVFNVGEAGEKDSSRDTGRRIFLFCFGEL